MKRVLQLNNLDLVQIEDDLAALKVDSEGLIDIKDELARIEEKLKGAYVK